jgi:hypothetical protein
VSGVDDWQRVRLRVLTLVHSMVAGGSHIDHADVLRAGNTVATP